MNMAPSDDPDLTQDLQTTNTEFDLSEDNTEVKHFIHKHIVVDSRRWLTVV